MKHNVSSNKKFIEQKALLLLILGVLTLSCLSILVFYNLYHVSKTNIINMWNNSAMELSQDVEFYLNTPKDAIKFTALRVEELQKKGASHEEINTYLRNETMTYSTLIESNSTGIYGFVDGIYLDGSGWTPPDDYEPTTRPWYTAAKKADGKIAFVKPFLNMQTNSMMMSVSILLSDNESVISMDIFLDSIQKLDEKMAIDNNIDIAMVIDKSGIIVSHSDAKEIGKNYLTDGNDLQKTMVHSVFTSAQNTFTLDTPHGEDLIFCDKINNEWYSVLILNKKDIFGSIKYIYILSAFTLVAVFILFSSILYIFYNKQKKVYELQGDIKAIADIYTSLDLLDFQNNTAKPLRDSPINQHFNAKIDNSIRNRDYALVSLLAAESSRNLLFQFMDVTTINERLKNINSISHEYLDNNNKWNRIQMIVVEREADGTVSKLLAAIQSIDEDKRQQENLKKLAQTDGLTSILNRNGGETLIYEYLETEKKGMFLLLDADNFKHVNDTYGHDKGDEVIIAIADCLTTTFRESDVVYRLGGDEFAIFALGVESKDTARLVLSRLFSNINKIKIDGIVDWKLQISVGAMLYTPSTCLNYSSIYKLIDSAMYESKQHKGNYYTLI